MGMIQKETLLTRKREKEEGWSGGWRKSTHQWRICQGHPCSCVCGSGVPYSWGFKSTVPSSQTGAAKPTLFLSPLLLQWRSFIITSGLLTPHHCSPAYSPRTRRGQTWATEKVLCSGLWFTHLTAIVMTACTNTSEWLRDMKNWNMEIQNIFPMTNWLIWEMTISFN